MAATGTRDTNVRHATSVPPMQGPAVWALRAQTDKLEYSHEMRKVLESAANLHLREGMATNLTFGANDEVTGLETHFGMRFGAAAVVLTTGTFMNGTIWVGRKQLPAGRCGLHFLCALGGQHACSQVTAAQFAACACLKHDLGCCLKPVTVWVGRKQLPAGRCDMHA